MMIKICTNCQELSVNLKGLMNLESMLPMGIYQFLKAKQFFVASSNNFPATKLNSHRFSKITDNGLKHMIKRTTKGLRLTNISFDISL